jgi:hypothetical protein
MCKCSKFTCNCTCISHPLHQSKLSFTYTKQVNINLHFYLLDSITNNKLDSTDICLLQSIYISCKVHSVLPYWLSCKMTFYFLIWPLIMCGHLKFAYETPPPKTVANWTALNWTIRIQTIARTAQYVRFALFWDIMQCRNNVSRQPISPSFKGQEIQKTEQSTTSVNQHNVLFWNFIWRLNS